MPPWHTDHGIHTTGGHGRHGGHGADSDEPRRAWPLVSSSYLPRQFNLNRKFQLSLGLGYTVVHTAAARAVARAGAAGPGPGPTQMTHGGHGGNGADSDSDESLQGYCADSAESSRPYYYSIVNAAMEKTKQLTPITTYFYVL